MSAAAVRSAFRSRLAAQVTGVTIVEVTGEFPAHPDPAAEWIAIEFLAGIESHAGMDAGSGNLWRETGTVQVHCFAPSGAGDADVVDRADEVRAAFRGQLFSGVRVWGVDPPQCGAGDQAGLWLRATVAMDYQFDLFA